MLKIRGKVAMSSVLAGLALLAFTAGPVFAQASSTTPSATKAHEQRHGMTGMGSAQQMPASMTVSEEMMERCMAMMNMMMPNMKGMMDQCMAMMQSTPSMQSMMGQCMAMMARMSNLSDMPPIMGRMMQQCMAMVRTMPTMQAAPMMGS